MQPDGCVDQCACNHHLSPIPGVDATESEDDAGVPLCQEDAS